MGLIVGGVVQGLHALGVDLIQVDGAFYYGPPDWTSPFAVVLGIVVLFGFLHLARGIGRVHAALAKQLLVKSTADA